MELRAVVIGAGWAGQGYIRALRAAGVEVAGLCARDPDAVGAVASEFDVPEVRLDWRSAVEDLLPDIVVVATPARAHAEIVELAAERGCHLLCEKPLALSASEAAGMLDRAEQAGVRHAYGATSRFAPLVDEARDLVASGVIGEPTDLEWTAHFEAPRLLASSWLHSLGDGGGLLFNALPHVLGQVRGVLGGGPSWVAGLADTAIERAPVGAPVHDFRHNRAVDKEAAAVGDWQKVDADFRATVIAGWEAARGADVRALFHMSGFTGSREPGWLEFAGTDGIIHLSGVVWPSSLEYRSLGDSGWTSGAAAPLDYVADPVQFGWNELTGRFIADIEGRDADAYPTFREGLADNRLIDLVRRLRPERIPSR